MFQTTNQAYKQPSTIIHIYIYIYYTKIIIVYTVIKYLYSPTLIRFCRPKVLRGFPGEDDLLCLLPGPENGTERRNGMARKNGGGLQG